MLNVNEICYISLFKVLLYIFFAQLVADTRRLRKKCIEGCRKQLKVKEVRLG